jgi:hypothetical protein
MSLEIKQWSLWTETIMLKPHVRHYITSVKFARWINYFVNTYKNFQKSESSLAGQFSQCNDL